MKICNGEEMEGIAIKLGRSMFCSPSSFFAILRFLKGLYMPYHACSRF